MAEIGVGMLGYAFMGKAHSNAFKKIPYLMWPAALEPKLVGIAGRNTEAVEEAARRYGWEYATNDWRDLVSDNRIGLFDNGGPNSLHAEPTIAAAEAGKHVVCEKPLGRDADESYDIWRQVAAILKEVECLSVKLRQCRARQETRLFIWPPLHKSCALLLAASRCGLFG